MDGVRLRLRADVRHDRDHRRHRASSPPEDHTPRARSACARPARRWKASSSRSSTPTASRLPPGEVGEIATRSASNMVGYWKMAGGDRADHRRRRLAAHRRRRLHGRGRLHLHPRPHQGHDHLRRREHLSGRSRERDLRPPRRRRSRRDRRARRQMGRERSRPSSSRSRARKPPPTRSSTFARERIAGYKIAEDRRLHRRAAAQSVGQDPPPASCASPIGRARPGG